MFLYTSTDCIKHKNLNYYGYIGLRKPLVSIVMAVRNEEKQVIRAVNSVLNQTYKNLEMIVIDDSSTDRTPEILRELAEKDNRISIVRLCENLGAAYARNIGIKHAEGEYIAILDADDWFHPRKIEIQVEFLEAKRKYGLVGTFCIALDPVRNRILKTRLPITHEEILKTMAYRNPFIHSSVIIRKSILDEVGYYNPRYKRAHDYDLYFRILSRSRAANIPRYLCFRIKKVHRKRVQLESILNSIIIPLSYFRVLGKNAIYYPLLMKRFITLAFLLIS